MLLADRAGGDPEAVKQARLRGLGPVQDPPPRPPGRRVLIVDDNRDVANSLCLLLELLGHQVRVAYSGPDGVWVGQQWLPEVVFCDVGLPGLDGYGVAAELRRLPGRRPCLVAVTAYGTEDVRRRARESGFDHFFTKPAEPRDLVALVDHP
jgi:CheY-like chemotaxis protein